MEKKTIVLLTYRDHMKDDRHAQCVEELRQRGVVTIETVGSPHIDIARSYLATVAMALAADVALFIDSDIVFEPDDVEKLADVARETRGVVGAPYALRQMGSGLGVGIVPQDDHVVFYDGGGLYEVTGVIGMGFTAIHVEVLEKISGVAGYEPVMTQQGAAHPFFQKLIVDGRWLHEDASFCETARRVGAPTQIDTRLRLTHLGDHGFRIEDSVHRIRPDENTLKIRVKLQ